MRYVLSFIGRSFAGAIGSLVAATLLAAFGITAPVVAKAAQSALGIAVPWYYVVAAQIGGVAAAILVVGLACVQQLKLERPLNEAVRRLLAKRNLSFGDIAERLPEIHPAYTVDDIVHCLMKAFWRGEFESSDGVGWCSTTGTEAFALSAKVADLCISRGHLRVSNSVMLIQARVEFHTGAD